MQRARAYFRPMPLPKRRLRPIAYRLAPPTHKLHGLGEDDETYTEIDVTSPEYLQAELERAQAAQQEVDSSLLDQFNAIVDGTTVRELQGASQRLANRVEALGELSALLGSGTSGDVGAAYQQASMAVAHETSAFNAAASQYNQIVSLIGNLSAGLYSPPQLSGMVGSALASLIMTPSVAFGINTLATSLQSLSGAESVSSDAITIVVNKLKELGIKPTAGELSDILDKAKKKSWLESLSDILKTSSDMSRNLAIAGLVGAGLFIGYKLLQKAGKI